MANIYENFEWQEYYEDVKKRGAYHNSIAVRNAKKYRRISLILALSIPILSAFVPFFTKFDVPWIKAYLLPFTALTVTIFSIIN